MEEAERADGWLAWCEDRGIYAAVSVEFADAMAAALGALPQPALEIGAGAGVLARALRGRGVRLLATDAGPASEGVESLSARAALSQYGPATVLACFPPIDALIEDDTMNRGSVTSFLYIGPLIYERVGPEALWRPGWRALDMPQVNAALLTRLDSLGDFTRHSLQRGAAAVLLQRDPGA
jgi:hypothetical protein